MTPNECSGLSSGSASRRALVKHSTATSTVGPACASVEDCSRTAAFGNLQRPTGFGRYEQLSI